MRKRMKAYLPKWMLWIMTPLLLLIWGFITYSAFATTSGRQELGTIGWLMLTGVFVLIGVMFWLMGSGKLPAYEIEFEDDDQPPRV